MTKEVSQKGLKWAAIAVLMGAIGHVIWFTAHMVRLEDAVKVNTAELKNRRAAVYGIDSMQHKIDWCIGHFRDIETRLRKLESGR